MISPFSVETRDAFDQCFLCGKYPLNDALVEFRKRTGVRLNATDIASRKSQRGNLDAYEIFPDALYALKYLQSFHVVTLSNVVPWSFVDLAATEVGPLIKRNFYSFNIHFAKPDPRAFACVEAEVGFSECKFYMVGDSVSTDILPAYRRGWNE
jgi:FMN phosphatase YigB (HAD superfamily)